MTPEGLHNYTRFLIQEARELIAQRNYNEAVFRCLIESTDGNSGWIKEVEDMFRKPQTLKDARLRRELKDVNLRAGKGLLQGITGVNHYLVAADVRAIEVCFGRLNPADIPAELSAKLDTLLLQCKRRRY